MNRIRSYISALAASASLIAIILTLLVTPRRNDISNEYLVIVILMTLLLIYSLATMKMRPEKRMYEVLLGSLHKVIYELRSLAAFKEDLKEKRLPAAVSEILNATREIYDEIAGVKCEVALFIILSEGKVAKWATTENENERMQEVDTSIFDNTPFERIYSGDRFFVSNDITKEQSFRASDYSWLKKYRSIAVFPIAVISASDHNIKQRVIIGFLSISAPAKNVFDMSSAKDNSFDITYRAGAMIADTLSLAVTLINQALEARMINRNNKT